jgi:hypothetical protein
MKKENWNNITKDSSERFTTLYKIGGKKELIKDLKELGFTYSETVEGLNAREQRIAKYKNTYFWLSG